MKKIISLSLFFILGLSIYSQNNCLQFHNVSTDYALYNNSIALNPTDIITVEAWINAASWRTNVHEGSIVGKDSWGAGDVGYMLRSGEGGDLSFVISIGGTWREARTTSNPMSTGTWYHVAGVYDGANVKIFIDGTEVASVFASGSISTSSVNLEIGRCPNDNNRYFDGYIDEVRIWHAALGQGILSAWNDKTVTNCHPEYANMIAYFEMDDISPGSRMWETIAGSDAGTTVSGASYVANSNVGFQGSVTGFQSTTVSQPNTTNVSPGIANNEVLRIEVEVYTAMNATELRIRTDGTTSIIDIANAKLWYTGSSSTFATTSQYGLTIASPPAGGVDMVFSNSVNLSCGKNYFWLSYDVQSGATLGNVIDGAFQQITVDGVNYVPGLTAPAGNRLIAINYCIPAPTSVDGSGITNVSLNVINNTTGDEPGHYGDYTALVADIIRGATDTCYITFSTGYTYDTKIWIDWNDDGDFIDTGEEVYSGTSQSANPTTLIAPFSIPVTAPLGNHKMRIGGVDIGPPTTCYTGSYGTFEDYTVNVLPQVAMTYVSSTASQPSTTDVSIGSTNQEIIRIEITTSGTLNPIDVSEIRIRTNGTTDFATDIVNAKLWYSGLSSVFTTSSQFSATVTTPSAPGADMVFSGVQTMETGTNYFWLTYDVPASATAGNYVDGTFQSVIVNGITQAPVLSAPTGSRLIIDGCHHVLTLYDSGLNGWQGGTVTVQVNGANVLTAMTLASGSTITFDFVANDGDAITTNYTAGTNPEENRYEVTNPNGAYILSDGHDSDVPSGTSGVGDCIGVPEFTVNGDTYQSGVACFILTENSGGQSGSVWYNYQIDLSTNFEIQFDVYLGDKDLTNTGEAGADGMTFALQGECSASGGDGGEMGYGGITPSIAVEFDSYRNTGYGDPVGYEDHLAILRNGNVNHGVNYNTVAHFEDDAWHSVRINWDEASTTFTVTFDGTLITSLTEDLVNTIFAGNPVVFWGFTAGTGAFYNRHEICVTSFPANSSALTDIYCDPCSEQVEVAQGAGSYAWTPNDSSINNPTIYNPVLSPTVTTTYTVFIEDACGNMITDNLTVHVGGLLGIELSEFNCMCMDEYHLIEWGTFSETNNDHFLIEKSSNAIDFIEVGKMEGGGNTSSLNNYLWKDYEKSNDIIYYRLKQMDFDGLYSYTEAIALKCDHEPNIQIYPNPTSYMLNIDMMAAKNEKITVKLSDLLGREIYSEKIELENNSIQKTFYLDDILDGVYQVIVIDNTSNEIIHIDKIIFRH